jgi:hypothetical protein
VAVDERSGQVLVASRSTLARADTPMTTARVSVLDGHSGAVLRTIPIIGDPVAVVVDERVGSAVLVVGASVRPWEDPWVQWARALQCLLPQQAQLACREWRHR